MTGELGLKKHGKGRFGRLSLKGIGGRTVVTRSEEYSSEAKSANSGASTRRRSKSRFKTFSIRNGSIFKQPSIDPESCSPVSGASVNERPDQRRTLYFAGDNERGGFAGIFWPKLSNEFPDKQLEAGYQKYSHRQRQKSLIIVNLIDIILKVVLVQVYYRRFYNESSRYLPKILGLLIAISFNCITIFFISTWKHCANNCLHIAAIVTWAMFNIEGITYGDCFMEVEALSLFIRFCLTCS